MNYAQRNRQSPHFHSSRARNGLSMPLKIVAAVVILLAVLYAFLPRVLPYFFLSIVRPLWKANEDARLGATAIEDLQKTFLELETAAAENNVIAWENEELKLALGRVSESHPLLAVILKKPPFSAYDSFILDAGADLGVKKGSKIFTLGGTPIGEIAEVIGNTSRARLYSSAGEKFDILIGPQNIEATALGKGGGYFEVSLPRDTKIKVGDEVRIPAIDNSFVGTVDGIASEASEPFAKILFHQPVNIYEQRWVIINMNE